MFILTTALPMNQVSPLRLKPDGSKLLANRELLCILSSAFFIVTFTGMTGNALPSAQSLYRWTRSACFCL